jgi:hypothetical protein
MTVNDVATNIVNKIGLSSSEGSSLVLVWLLAGYRDLCSKLHPFKSKVAIAITSGVDEYQLDVTISAVEDITILNSLVKPDRVTREEILDLRRYSNSGTTQGDVYCYNLEGNLLMIYPTPTSNSTMEVYGTLEASTAPAFVGTETLSTTLGLIPLGPLQKCLEYYGLWQASEYDDKAITDNSLGYLSQYNAFILEARKALNHRAGRGFTQARVGYPVKRGFPRRNDVYPALSRQES